MLRAGSDNAQHDRRHGPPAFYLRVYQLVRRIPRGKVATYGQVAAILGRPRGARAVGMALAALERPLLDSVPWQRVINGAGRCSHRDGFWADIQRDLLSDEGVEVIAATEPIARITSGPSMTHGDSCR